MKKLLSILLAAALAVPMFAERPTPEERANADYSAWLPQAGDFSVGFNFDPIATFVGNMFNNTVGNNLAAPAGQTLTDRFAGGMPHMASIMGTYMATDRLGIRANIGLAISTRTDRAYVQDDAAKFFNPYSTLEGLDRHKKLDLGASFSVGVEYRVGKRRVQGVFGLGATYGFWGIRKDSYSYYNAITAGNQNPSQAGLAGTYVNPKFATDYSFIDNPRLLEMSGDVGHSHVAGIYGSVGVEWFVAPKISLGLNVNLLLDYQWTAARTQKWEGWNNILRERQEITIHDTAMQDGFTFTTDNIGANLYVAFYFGK